MAHDVFISHASEDKNIADAACAKLEERGVRCWIAPRDVQPGANWGEAIIDAISISKIMVFVFSSHSNQSQNVIREIERAAHKEVTIIPLRVENILPSKSLEYFISAQHWLDAITPPIENHLNILADKIHLTLGQTPLPPAPVKKKYPLVKVISFLGLALLLAGLAWVLISGRVDQDSPPVVADSPSEVRQDDDMEQDSFANIPETNYVETADVTSQIDVEPNGSLITANRLILDDSVRGDIGVDNDQEDWYRIAMPAQGTIHFRVKNLHNRGTKDGSINPVVLSNERGDRLTHTNRIEPASTVNSSSISVSAGEVCYIQVPANSQCSAPYSLSCHFNKIDASDAGESNQDRNSALELKASGGINAVVGFKDNLEDWYKVVMPANGVLKFSVKNLHDRDIKYGIIDPVVLSNERGDRLTHTNRIEPASTVNSDSVSMSAGEPCYIQVPARPLCSAPYRLSCNFYNIDASDAGESNQDRNSAHAIDVNGGINALIGFNQDQEDWYKVVVPTNGKLKLRVKNLHDRSVRYSTINPVLLFNERSDKLTHTNRIESGSEVYSKFVPVSAGPAYYIQIQPREKCSAPYSLSCIFTPD